MEDKYALEIKDLCCHYGHFQALKDVSLKLQSGRICGLLGPNGSGKTTLFRSCLKLNKISGGDILMERQSILSLSPSKLAQLASYVPQEAKMTFPFSVREVVMMGRSPRMKSFIRTSKKDRDVVDAALEDIGISHLANKMANCLSGGQRQLVLIARAVAQESSLMFLDEPTSALDFQNQIVVWKTLRKLRNQGFTIVVCTHDPNHILWFCDSVLLLKKGKVLAYGEPLTVMKQETLNQLYEGACIRGEVNQKIPMVYPNFENISPITSCNSDLDRT